MARGQQLSKSESDTRLMLAGVELFSGLLDDDIAYVSSRTGSLNAAQNTVLFSAGEAAVHFFIVRSGSVSITTKTPEGDQFELARYVAGDVFGDFHFVINGLYNATAVTLEKTELLVFPGEGLTFDRIADEKPDTASRILLRSITMIASRLRSTNQLIAENRPWIRELRKQIYTDPPTGLWNKYYMDSELPHLLSGTVAVLMVKPDRFKELNDQLGHAAGDLVLEKLAELLIKETRLSPHGWAVRLRSNEMCLILPETDLEVARFIAARVSKAFPALLPKDGTAEGLVFTASMAIGIWPEDNENWNWVADQTNQMMQDLWKAGGNRIVLLREALDEKK